MGVQGGQAAHRRRGGPPERGSPREGGALWCCTLRDGVVHCYTHILYVVAAGLRGVASRPGRPGSPRVVFGALF